MRCEGGSEDINWQATKKKLWEKNFIKLFFYRFEFIKRSSSPASWQRNSLEMINFLFKQEKISRVRAYMGRLMRERERWIDWWYLGFVYGPPFGRNFAPIWLAHFSPCLFAMPNPPKLSYWYSGPAAVVFDLAKKKKWDLCKYLLRWKEIFSVTLITSRELSERDFHFCLRILFYIFLTRLSLSGIYCA